MRGREPPTFQGVAREPVRRHPRSVRASAHGAGPDRRGAQARTSQHEASAVGSARSCLARSRVVILGRAEWRTVDLVVPEVGRARRGERVGRSGRKPIKRDAESHQPERRDRRDDGRASRTATFRKVRPREQRRRTLRRYRASTIVAMRPAGRARPATCRSMPAHFVPPAPKRTELDLRARERDARSTVRGRRLGEGSAPDLEVATPSVPDFPRSGGDCGMRRPGVYVFADILPGSTARRSTVSSGQGRRGRGRSRRPGPDRDRSRCRPPAGMPHRLQRDLAELSVDARSTLSADAIETARLADLVMGQRLPAPHHQSFGELGPIVPGEYDARLQLIPELPARTELARRSRTGHGPGGRDDSYRVPEALN